MFLNRFMGDRLDIVIDYCFIDTCVSFLSFFELINCSMFYLREKIRYFVSVSFIQFI